MARKPSDEGNRGKSERPKERWQCETFRVEMLRDVSKSRGTLGKQ